MKVAVIFPGIGYHIDKPLLYYSIKLAKKAGYDILPVKFEKLPENVKGSPERMEAAFCIALSQAESILAQIEWDKYEDILFISKSIGTAVAGAYAVKKSLSTRNIYYTPIEESFSVMKCQGIVFHGTSDEWAVTGKVREKCNALDFPLHIIEKGDHSLETGNAITDIENMRKIMEISRNYIENI